jgi:hypothetical protein
MSAFAAEWLALREAADAHARNSEIAEALAARLGARESIAVVDLACGTGANLRATAPLLGGRQRWTLVDNDRALLAAAADALAGWADAARREDDVLVLAKGGRELTVQFRNCDLSRDVEGALGTEADLVTSSAFLDLASASFVKRLVHAVAARRAVFHTVLTYNGVQRWRPRHPADAAVTAAFHRHQTRDKGFGPAVGPAAPAHLSDQLRIAGYSVLEGDSPWRLGPADAALIKELQEGVVAAVAETRAIDLKTLATWSKVRRTGAEVGHTDTLAFPGDPFG